MERLFKSGRELQSPQLFTESPQPLCLTTQDFCNIMRQRIIPFVCNFSYFLLPLLFLKFIIAKNLIEYLDKEGVWPANKSKGTKLEQPLIKDKKDSLQATKIGFESLNSQPSFLGLDYKSADRPWQRDANEKKPEKKRATKKQWRRKNAARKKRTGRKKQHQSRMKQKGLGKANSGGGNTNKNRRGKGKTNRKQMRNTNPNEKTGNWGGGKTRNWKGKKKSNGKGKRKSQLK